MCDESVVHLQGEVEVMRTRKAVLLCVSKQEHSGDSLPSTRPNDCCSEVARGRHKLKLQRKRSNFLRVKLGWFAVVFYYNTCILGSYYRLHSE